LSTKNQQTYKYEKDNQRDDMDERVLTFARHRHDDTLAARVLEGHK
jgi:hypothetical protein